MTAIFGGTQTEFSDLEKYFQTYPTDNFTYIFSNSKSSIATGKNISDKEDWQSTLSCECKQEGMPYYFPSNIGEIEMYEGTKTNLPQPSTIKETIQKLSSSNKLDYSINKFTKLILSDKYFSNFLNKNNNISLFVPVDKNYDKLIKFYKNQSDKQYRGEYLRLRLADILRGHIVKAAIYPEQLKDRTYRIQTMLNSSNIVMKDMVIINQFGEEEDDTSNSEILDSFLCSNGIVYIISSPILPGGLLGITNNDI